MITYDSTHLNLTLCWNGSKFVLQTRSDVRFITLYNLSTWHLIHSMGMSIWTNGDCYHY